MLVPIKTWTEGVPFEDEARKQVERLAELPIVGPHVAIMPDVHAGIGCVVGSVVPTRRAVIPAAVGVDIGCGMIAAKTSLRASDLPDSLHDMFVSIAQAVPHGSAKGDRGVGAHPVQSARWSTFASMYRLIVQKHPKIETPQAPMQLGTLGGGNHFIEVCLDQADSSGPDGEEPNVWVVLHSGSRGVGNKIGSYFTERAREAALKLDRQLPDKDLAWLDEGTADFNDYWQALLWAQNYAATNRDIMLMATLRAMEKHVPVFDIVDKMVNCHHNYASVETHFCPDTGRMEELYITRKGAVSARPDEMGIIPGSMGAKTFIVRGKGNKDSFHSCSHGAGRVMSRGAAKKSITLEQHAADTAGVECTKDARVLDESPRAYKRIEDVMHAQRDLVDVVAVLKQVLCIKG
jgi:tRNA-splicing ligase RtcB (3'-phosphate/5'-hydroxy nucleic acid ligase)